MGIRRGCAALALIAPGAFAAQEPHPLALRAAELRETDAGTRAQTLATATALVALLHNDREAAAEIAWVETLDDVCTALLVRDVADEVCTNFAWEVAVGLRTGGDLARARAVLQEHLHERRPSREDRYLPWVHVELADFARHEGAWAEARRHLDAARELLVPDGADPFAAARPEQRELALALGTWCDVAGQLYLELGRTELAARAFDAHLDHAEALGDEALFWGAIDNQVRLALAADRLTEVEALWDRARNAPFWQSGRPADRAKLRLALGQARVELERAGEREEGAAFETLVGVLEEPGAYEHDAFEAELMLATSALDAGALGEAEDWLAAARERRVAWNHGAGVEAPAASRSRFGLEALGWRLARAAGEDERIATAYAESRAAFERFLASWSDAPLAAEGVGFLQSRWRRDFLAEVLALDRAALGEERGRRAVVADVLEVQVRGTLTRALGAQAVTLEEVQSEFLGPGCGALVYVPGREASLGLALSRDAVELIELAPARVLRRASRALAEAAGEAIVTGGATNEAQLTDAIRRASDRLLPPELWRVIQHWDEVVIVAAEGAGIFGLECLVTGSGEPLGLVKAVSHVPSLPVGVALARAARTAAPRKGVWLLAPADAISPPPGFETLPPVPFDEAHADELCALYGREESRIVAGASAKMALLRSPELGRRAALDVIAHGLFDPTRPRPAGLLLANGEALFSAEVEALDVPPLVTLVACGTARGPLRLGDDGRAHLGAAFLAAGARVVLMGATELEYRASLLLDGVFHERLAEGVPPAEALRRARVAAVESAPGVPAVHHLLVRAYGLGSAPLPLERPAAGPFSLFRVLVGLALLFVLALVIPRALRRHGSDPRKR